MRNALNVTMSTNTRVNGQEESVGHGDDGGGGQQTSKLLKQRKEPVQAFQLQYQSNRVATATVLDRQRRKASVPHRFSVDYYGFPRIPDYSDDESDSGSGTKSGGVIGPTTNNNNCGSSREYSFYDKSTFPYSSSVTMREAEGKGNRRLQYLATLAANMGAFAFGTALSYPAVALPSLREDVVFRNRLTGWEESWIGSVLALGAVVSGPVAGFAIERFGRRMSMLVLSVPFFLSWMLIYIASDVEMVIGGRFLTGFFSGVFLVASPIFTAEIADVAIRGAVGATFDMSSSVGILFIYIVGTYSTWRTQALICAIIPIFIFLLLLFVPESPAYLLGKGRLELAKESLIKYKGTKSDPQQILAAFDDLQQEVIDSKAAENASFGDLLTRPILMPVSIAFMVFLFQVICGLDPILIYTVDIFKSAGDSSASIAVDEYTCTIIFGVINLVSGVMAAFFVDKTGRRFLLLLSESVMVLSLLALGGFFFIRRGVAPANGIPAPEASSSLAWLPLTSLSFYILAYSIGLGPVGYLLMGEILPLRVKGLAGSLLTSAKWLLSFLVTKFFDDIVLLIGEAGCFWLFAGFCGLGGLYIYLFVPETKGRSLEDIQRTFRRRYSLERIQREEVEEETKPLLYSSNGANNYSGRNGDDNENPA